jgi:hypothetical protein
LDFSAHGEGNAEPNETPEGHRADGPDLVGSSHQDMDAEGDENRNRQSRDGKCQRSDPGTPQRQTNSFLMQINSLTHHHSWGGKK